MPYVRQVRTIEEGISIPLLLIKGGFEEGHLEQVLKKKSLCSNELHMTRLPLSASKCNHQLRRIRDGKVHLVVLQVVESPARIDGGLKLHKAEERRMRGDEAVTLDVGNKAKTTESLFSPEDVRHLTRSSIGRNVGDKKCR